MFSISVVENIIFCKYVYSIPLFSNETSNFCSKPENFALMIIFGFKLSKYIFVTEDISVPTSKMVQNSQQPPGFLSDNSHFHFSNPPFLYFFTDWISSATFISTLFYIYFPVECVVILFDSSRPVKIDLTWNWVTTIKISL